MYKANFKGLTGRDFRCTDEEEHCLEIMSKPPGPRLLICKMKKHVLSVVFKVSTSEPYFL